MNPAAFLRRVRNRAGRAARRLLPARPVVREVYDVFTDGRGYRFELERGFRDRVKPGWRRMLEPPAESLSPRELAQSYQASMDSVRQALSVVRAAGATVDGGRAMEIGCLDGRRSYALAELGDFEVAAIDLTEYYVEQSPDVSQRPAAMERAAARLDRFRRQTRQAFEGAGARPARLDRVRFLEEDACATRLPDGELDLIVSWEVLEHIRDPEAAFREMARLLRPGGVAFHEYNPFFCFSGGHSLCTLDFPFAHARLPAADFERYVRKYRPDEADQDLRFFHSNLNRMTMADLRAACARAGLEVVSMLAWPRRDDLAAVTPEIFRQVRELYPTLVVDDLVCRSVWVTLRKPAA